MLRTLKTAKSVVWDCPTAMLSPGVKDDRLARMGVRCVWFLATFMLAPPVVSAMTLLSLPVAVTSVVGAVLITGAAGSALGAATVMGAAARRGKLREQTRYWRDTVREGLSDWNATR